jgi:hypothetical protein
MFTSSSITLVGIPRDASSAYPGTLPPENALPPFLSTGEGLWQSAWAVSVSARMGERGSA